MGKSVTHSGFHALSTRPLSRADLDAQRAHEIADGFVRAGAEENHVAVLRADGFQNAIERLVVEELDDRRGHAFAAFRDVVDANPGEAFRAVFGDVETEIVEVFARLFRAIGQAQRDDAAARIVGRTAEHFEFDVLDVIGDVDQFERDAQVGFVGTVAAHRFFVGHARERIVELHVDDFLEDMTDHRLDRVLHVAFRRRTRIPCRAG